MGKTRKMLTEANIKNAISKNSWLARLVSIALSNFVYQKLPQTINRDFMEWRLLCGEKIALFEDEVLGALALPVTSVYMRDVYGLPLEWEVFAPFGGYHRRLNVENAVILWDNVNHYGGTFQTLNMYADRLSDIQRTIDVNVANQKTPILVSCSQEQKLSLENAMMQRDSNIAALWVLKDSFDMDAIRTLDIQPEYIADKAQILSRQLWNEALTFLGVENSNTEKRERLVTEEITSNLGGVNAMRQTRLIPRQEAFEKANALFGWEVSVDYVSADIDKQDEGGVLFG